MDTVQYLVRYEIPTSSVVDPDLGLDPPEKLLGTQHCLLEIYTSFYEIGRAFTIGRTWRNFGIYYNSY